VLRAVGRPWSEGESAAFVPDFHGTCCAEVCGNDQFPHSGGPFVPVRSIARAYTATLVMQLVDSGELRLGTWVVDVLPDFSVADGPVPRPQSAVLPAGQRRQDNEEWMTARCPFPATTVNQTAPG
jgi:hypothetical protein